MFTITEKQRENADFALALERVYRSRGTKVYEGTVSHLTKRRRRAANKVARHSRRVNRQAA